MIFNKIQLFCVVGAWMFVSGVDYYLIRQKPNCLGEYCDSDPSLISNLELKIGCQQSKLCVEARWSSSAHFDPSQTIQYRLRYRIVLPQSLRSNYSTHILTDSSYTMDTHNKPAYGVTYEFRVSKFFKERYGRASVKNISLPEAAPSDSPKKLNKTEIDQNRISVTWEAPNPIYHNGIIIFYQVRYYAVNHEEKTERIFNVSSTKVELSDLYYPEYKIFVRAFTKVGAGIWSNPLYYYGPNIQDLPLPINVKAYRQSSTELLIKWSLSEQSDKIKGFVIFYTKTTLQEWQKHSTESVDLSAHIKGLEAYTNYRVKVAAVNSQGLHGNFSKTVEEMRFTIPSLKSRTVQDLRCSVMDSKMLKLEWLAPVITSDIIKFEIFYSAKLSYTSSMNLKKSEYLDKIKVFLNFEANVQKYFLKLDDLQSNAVYTITVRPIYQNDAKTESFQSSLETTCRTGPSLPSILVSAVPIEVLVDKQLVKLKVFRCSERNGILSNYTIVVGAWSTTGTEVLLPLQEPSQYSLTDLSLNTKTIEYSGPYITISKHISLLFTEAGRNTIEVLLGNQAKEDYGTMYVSNKRLDTNVYYKVFTMVCLEEKYGDKLCMASNWSSPFNINEMTKKQRISSNTLNKTRSVVNKNSGFNYTLVLIVLLTSGVFLAIACIIFGCVIKRRKWTKRLININNTTFKTNKNNARSTILLKSSSECNSIKSTEKYLLNSDIKMANNHCKKYSTVPDLVTADSVLMCQDGSKLSPFSNHRPDNNGITKNISDKPPTSVSELYQYISTLKANDGALLEVEFSTLNTNLDDRFSWKRSNIDSNKSKNRYANVVAYDHTSVLLRSIDDVIGSDYINANFIDGYRRQNAYIATQGPLPDTTDDFWRMIWEQNSISIVMMTRLEERSAVKCHQYWPNRGFICYGQMIVCHIETFVFSYYTIRLLELRHSKFGEKREIHHFQFTAWPDHGVPKLSTPLLMFIRRYRSMAKLEFGPTVVHCSAGVGRTGAFIVIEAQLERMKHEKTVDLFNFVSKIRCQRNYMVQTQAQYLFILETLLEAVEDGNTEVIACNLHSHVSKLSQIGLSGTNELSGFELEFSKLNSLASNRDRQGMMLADFVKAAGNQPVNLTKNKIRNIIPYDWNRVILPAIRGIEGSDYINASYIDGYRDRRAYIAAQGPLPSSVEDFWRMIWDQHCGVVVVLNKPQEEKGHIYWPVHKSIRYQFFVVDPIVEYNMPNYILREFKVTDARDGEFRTLRQFQFTQWPSHGCPKECDSILDFIRQVHKTKEQFGHMEPMIVHCSTGSGRTGVFIALSIVIDRLQHESVIDMYQTVKLLHKQRLGLVQTEEQYEFCYKSVVGYLSYYEKNEKNCSY